MIFSIGYEGLGWDRFADHLRHYDISLLVDIRSRPNSRNAAFKQRTLTAQLWAIDIDYRWEGKLLGGKVDDPGRYRRHHGRDILDHNQMAGDSFYVIGIAKLLRLEREGPRLALMCMCSDPMDCHRGYTVANSLQDSGIMVRHILPNGSVTVHNSRIGRR